MGQCSTPPTNLTLRLEDVRVEETRNRVRHTVMLKAQACSTGLGERPVAWVTLLHDLVPPAATGFSLKRPNQVPRLAVRLGAHGPFSLVPW